MLLRLQETTTASYQRVADGSALVHLPRKKPMKKIIALFCTALFPLACSGAPDPVVIDNKSPVTEYVGDTGVITGCNALTNIGATVNSTTDSSVPPTMTGGTIADGTYVLTSVVMYTGIPVVPTDAGTGTGAGVSNGPILDNAGGGISNGSNLCGNPGCVAAYVLKQTMLIAGNNVQIVTSTSNEIDQYGAHVAAGTASDTGIITTSGIKFKITFSCSSTAGLGTSADYTSTIPVSTVLLVAPAAPSIRTLNSDGSVFTYVKQ